jgi:aryl-alcohol dehydrogenase-like predicted oxidoreductase
MKREARRTSGTDAAAHASRRRFLSSVVIGAAYTACAKHGGSAAGGSGGSPGARDAGMNPKDMRGSVAADLAPPNGGPADAELRADAATADVAADDTATVTNRKAASDQVMLGKTGIRISRLAMGSGTHGTGGTSEQTRLGVQAFARLLVQSYHEQGLTFWETADAYGSHPHVGEAIRQVGRDKVVILTKSHASTAAEMQADLDRFRRELGIEQIDIVLLHAIQSGTWTQQYAGAMEALASAKERGIIRAHGTSCHSLAALRLAARTPWVDVDLARINPATIEMDADPATVISVLREMKAAGKGVVGMKILGVGQLATRMDTALGHAVRLDAIDGFTIGFRSIQQLQQVTTKISQIDA